MCVILRLSGNIEKKNSMNDYEKDKTQKNNKRFRAEHNVEIIYKDKDAGICTTGDNCGKTYLVQCY
ncbi:unnamed protein product, partial [Allacma fusca]